MTAIGKRWMASNTLVISQERMIFIGKIIVGVSIQETRSKHQTKINNQDLRVTYESLLSIYLVFGYCLDIGTYWLLAIMNRLISFYTFLLHSIERSERAHHSPLTHHFDIYAYNRLSIC